MKKIYFVCGLLIMGSNVFAQNKGTDKGFFIAIGGLYNSEKIDSDPKFTTSGMNITSCFGYDFESITINLVTDMMLFERVEYQGWGYSRDVQMKTADNVGVGVNLGIKLVNGRVFDIILPIGCLIRGSEFEVKHDEERKFEYMYINVESGLILSWHLSNFFAVYVPFNIGYPVYQDSKVENYAKKDYEVFHYSFGIGFQINYSNIFKYLRHQQSIIQRGLAQ
ncbi:MAG: hypothetical protein LBT00_08720 [Spirochaetaceae bacterium]|nr:hypothetical protein [Spirochaetaceae bacterium]